MLHEKSLEEMNLEEFRRNMGKSQTEMHKLCDLTKNTYIRLEKGERYPTTESILKIAKATKQPSTTIFQICVNTKNE